MPRDCVVSSLPESAESAKMEVPRSLSPVISF